MQGENKNNNFLNLHIGCLFYKKNKIYNNIFKLLKKTNINHFKIVFIQSKSNKNEIINLLKKNKINPVALQKKGTFEFLNTPISPENKKAPLKTMERFIKNKIINTKKKLIFIIDNQWLHYENKIDKLLYAKKINNNLIINYKFTLFCLFDINQLNSEYIKNIFISHPFISFKNELLKNIYFNKNLIYTKEEDNKILNYYISTLIEYKQLNQKLINNEKKLLSVINLLPNIFIRIDHNGMIKYVNNQFEDISGYTFNNLLNKNFFNVFIKKSIKTFLKNNILKKDLTNYEISLTSKNGEVKNLLLFSKKTEDEILLIGTDITRRRIIEEKLFDLSRRFASIFKILPVGLVLANEDGVIFQINEKLKELTGYNEFDLIGTKCFKSLCFKNICPLIKKKDGEKEEDIITLKKKNREIHVIRSCQKIILNKKIWLLLTLTDITNIRKAEEEQIYSLKLEQLLNKIIFQLINSKNMENDINHCFNIIGNELKLSEIGLFEFIFKDKKIYLKQTYNWGKNKISDNLGKLDINSLPFFNNEILKKTQNIIINNINDLPDYAVNERLLMEQLNIKSAIICPLVYNKVFGFIGFTVINKAIRWKKAAINSLTLFSEILVSIISKQKIEKKFIRNEKKFMLIAEESEDMAYYILSDNGKIIKWNKGAEKFYGYNEKEILFKNFDFITKNKKASEEKLNQAKEKNKYVTLKPERRIKKNGEIILVEENIISLKENNQIINYAVINKNVTEKESFIRELIESQKLDAVGKLASGLAHNFNNIFTTMSGYMELIFQDINTSNPIYDNLEKMYNSLNNAIETSNHLIHLGKKNIVQFAPVNINDIINNLTPLIRTVLGEKIKLVLELDNNSKTINADSSQIEQIIINLINNGKDAIIDEGLLVIETEYKILEKDIITDFINIPAESYVLLKISDTGCGIPDNIKEKIFTPFFSTKENQKGLGLTIIYNIVKQHSGYISFKNNQDGGTIFEIYFPSSEKGAIPVLEKKAADKEKFINMTILLVEDDNEIKDLMETILVDAGANVLTANNGKDALSIIQSKKNLITFLITDIIMPNMNGNELHLQAKKIIPDLKALFISGYNDVFINLDKKVQKETEFLQKPFTAKKLLEKINLVVNKE